MLPVEQTFKPYTGLDGKPLNNGYVYFGQPNVDPIANPVTVFWDAAGTLPAAQPLRTVNGYIMNAGTPANIYFTGTYSELVQDAKGRQVSFATTSAGFLPAGAGATARSVQDKLRDIVSVKDFGAKGDGVTNDTAAFKAAALASARVHIPGGNYVISDTISLTQYGAQWEGSGRQNTIITMAVSNKPIFKVPNNNGVVIRCMSLDRSVPATAGGDGIYAADVIVGQSLIEDMIILNQWHALNLGPTDYSTVRDMIITQNYQDGVHIGNEIIGGNAACQWYLHNVLCQRNDGAGFRFVASGTGGQISVGTVVECATYANKVGGLFAVGSATCRLMALRVTGGFYGEDGNHAIFLDTYGEHHVLQGIYTELAGTAPTGRVVSTPKSNIGSGIAVSGNNGVVRIVACTANGHSEAGFSVSAASQILTGCTAMGNGASGNGRFGVLNQAGRIVISGGAFGNNAGVTLQNYGVYVADGANCSIVACDLSNNQVAAFEAAANRSYISSVGNLPNNLPVGLSPSGAVTVGGGVTGGFGAAGSINVAANVLRNGTPLP